MDHIFGPVYSRRFGVSLGVDLSSDMKQCNFDCLYCELEKASTTDAQHVITPIMEIKSDIKAALTLHSDLDVVTITANGEPTLYPYLDAVIDFVNLHKGTAKSLILSNGAMICDEKVQQSLKKLDIVKLSLDSACSSTYRKLDRPHTMVDMDALIACMHAFKESYKGLFVIEVLVVKHINDTEEEFISLKKALDVIRPDRVDVGTIARPPAYNVEAVSEEVLFELAELLSPHPVFVASVKQRQKKALVYTREDILSTLAMRPLDADEVEWLFDENSKKLLDGMVEAREVLRKEFRGKVFYKNLDKT